jgi:hypothetical protein
MSGHIARGFRISTFFFLHVEMGPHFLEGATDGLYLPVVEEAGQPQS